MSDTVKPGIYDMRDAQYHRSPGVSNSMLNHFARSPMHYQHYINNPPEATPAMVKGKALHSLILEPQEFTKGFAVLPKDAPKKPSVTQLNAKNPREKTIEAIEFWHEFQQKAQGKDILTFDQHEEYAKLAAGVSGHPEAERFISDGLAEKAVFARDPETGLLVRCKIDYMADLANRLILTDLKSTADARPFQFQRSAYNYGYFRQAAFYIDLCNWAGIEAEEPFVIIAFEPDPPHGVHVYEISGEQLERGRQSYRALLNRLAECKEKDEWPGYDTDITPLIYPSWAMD